MGSIPEDATTVESLLESIKKEHAKRDHNAVCRACGTTRYIPFATKSTSQTTRTRACWGCERVQTFDIDRDL